MNIKAIHNFHQTKYALAYYKEFEISLNCDWNLLWVSSLTINERLIRTKFKLIIKCCEALVN